MIFFIMVYENSLLLSIKTVQPHSWCICQVFQLLPIWYFIATGCRGLCLLCLGCQLFDENLGI